MHSPPSRQPVSDRRRLVTVVTMHHLPPSALAERWDTTKGHLANLRSRAEGPPYLKIGARVLYPLDGIEQYEAARLVQTGSAA
jgi:hypothetical protein